MDSYSEEFQMDPAKKFKLFYKNAFSQSMFNYHNALIEQMEAKDAFV